MAKRFRNIESFNRNTGTHVTHLNLRSVRNKKEDFFILLKKNNLDVLTFSETWLKEKDNSNEYLLDDFKLYRNDRTWFENGKEKGGGGSMIYVRNDYVVSILPVENISTKDLEAQILVIRREKMKDLLIINVYRAPDGNFASFWFYFSGHSRR